MKSTVESNDRMVNDDFMLTYEVQMSAEVSASLGHCPPELNYARLSISCPVQAFSNDDQEASGINPRAEQTI